MKVYIERNNLQLELILILYDTGKDVDFIHIYFCEVTDSMEYCPPNRTSQSFEHRPVRSLSFLKLNGGRGL